MPRFIAVATMIAVCAGTSQAVAALAIQTANTYASVSNGSGSTDSDSNANQAGGTATATLLPGYLSDTVSSFSAVGNSGIFAGSFSQKRAGAPFGYATGSVLLNFTVDVNTPYAASGSYSNFDGYTGFSSYLSDQTSAIYLYASNQENIGGAALFTLGGPGGNLSNYFSGSLTGTLLAGHDYQWYAQGTTQAYPGTDSGGTASGSVSLVLTPTAVPEFSSAIVWSLLAVSIGAACWWQRSRLSA